MTDGRPAIYRLRDVTKTRAYGSNSFVFSVPSLTIAAGEVVALKGASGSGKSTLLDLLAGTLRPDTADVFEFAPDGNGPIDIAGLWRRSARDRLTALRGHHIGYVLQTGGLLPYLSARDNIALSARLLGKRVDGEIDRIVARLGIARLLDKKPGQLSVGERQRVAIARALAHRPTVVLADEPTASVDPIVGDQIFALFIDLVATLGATAIIASHDWDRLEAAGLRSLHHKLERDGDATRSYFWS